MRPCIVLSLVWLSGVHSAAAQVAVTLKPGASTTRTSPQWVGISLGNLHQGDNAGVYLTHLGVNSARLWMTPVSDLRGFVGSSWGKGLDGADVRDATSFDAAVA